MKPFNFKIFARPRFFELFGLFFLLYLSVAAQTFQHARRMGCDKAEDRGAAIVVDKQGNQYSTGFFRSFNGIGALAADMDPGPAFFPLESYEGGYGVYVSKLSKEGNFVWAKQFKGIGDAIGRSISIDNNSDIYISGTFDFDPGPNVFTMSSFQSLYDIFIVKLDSDGNFIWARTLRGNGEEDNTNGLTLDYNGDVLISGYFSGKIDLDPGPDTLYTQAWTAQFQTFLVKLNSNGNLTWGKNIGGYASESPGLAVDSINNCYISGLFFGISDLNPEPNIEYLVQSKGQFDIFITKLSSSGDFLWVKTLGTTDYENVSGFQISKSQNLYISGGFSGDTLKNTQTNQSLLINHKKGKGDAFVIKLDRDGEFKWGQAIGDTAYEDGKDIKLTKDGYLYVAGWFQDSVDFDAGPGKYFVKSESESEDFQNSFILKLDTNGLFQRVLPILGKRQSMVESIFLDSLQNLHATGWFNSGPQTIATDFDPGPGQSYLIPSLGGTIDIFILKLRSCQTDSVIESVSACRNFLWNNTTYSQSGTYTRKLSTPNGCDSIQVLNLEILEPILSNNSYTFCKGESLQIGTRIYTQPGVYLDTLTATNGCDSLITSTLNYDIPNDTILLNGLNFTAADNQDSYQWLDCNQGFLAIAGATQQSFTPTSNGSYAVKTTKGNCADTSDCVLFTSGKDLLTSQIRIYPQPVKDKLYIEMPETSQSTELILIDAMGRIVVKEKGRNIQSISVLKLPAGLYQLKVFTGKEMQVFAVMVEK
jgi:hypothetical protein